jgi:hypothetical protein
MPKCTFKPNMNPSPHLWSSFLCKDFTVYSAVCDPEEVGQPSEEDERLLLEADVLEAPLVLTEEDTYS